MRLFFLMEMWAFFKAHSKTRYGSLNHLTWIAFPTSSLIFTRSFPLEMVKQNVLQSIIHTVTVQMTVKVNSEICIRSSSVKAINLLTASSMPSSKGLVEVWKISFISGSQGGGSNTYIVGMNKKRVF